MPRPFDFKTAMSSLLFDVNIKLSGKQDPKSLVDWNIKRLEQIQKQMLQYEAYVKNKKW